MAQKAKVVYIYFINLCDCYPFGRPHIEYLSRNPNKATKALLGEEIMAITTGRVSLTFLAPRFSSHHLMIFKRFDPVGKKNVKFLVFLFPDPDVFVYVCVLLKDNIDWFVFVLLWS